MKKKTVCGFFALFASAVFLVTGCSKDSKNFTVKKGTLMVGMEIGYPPMEYYDSDGTTLLGFDVEMGRAIAEKIGLEVEFVDMTWNGLFHGLETNRYDCIISSVTITPERLAAHNFSKPYFVNSMSIISLKSSAVKPLEPAELAGLAVAYQAESTSKYFTERLIKDGLKFAPFEYDKVMNCFDDLSLGRVDAVVADSIGALDYINEPDSKFEITWLGEPDQFFGICTKKGNDALTEAIENALDGLFEEGTMSVISGNYLNADMVSAARQ